MTEADPATAGTTPAIGGERRVPTPDGVAGDYLLLGLRLDQHVSGLVDGYLGPADLKARADMESLRSPDRLAADADALLGRISTEVAEVDRRDWLTRQVVALRTQAEALAGRPLPYLDSVERCFAWRPTARPEALFDRAAAELDDLLPGEGPVADRLTEWDERFTIPVDRVMDVAGWLVGRFRARAAGAFGLPDGEDLRVRLVTKQPWSGYNWYDGGRRSRVDLNTDLPIRAAELIHVIAHETYPGHHLEHAWKEARLVDEARRLEASILLINTPECLISEGLADLGHRFASPADEEPDLLVELYDRAGLAIAADPADARDAAERTVAIATHRRTLAETRVNAALLRHADERDHDEVLRWLIEVGRYAPDVAAKRLEFIEHPLWRTYVFVYAEGEALLRRWLELVPPDERPARFGRLLREQLTPPAIVAEIDAGIEAAAGGPAAAIGAGVEEPGATS